MSQALEQLKKIIDENPLLEEDFRDLIDSIEKTLEEKEERITDLEEQVTTLEEDTTHYVELGLDTLHYRFEKQNLRIQQLFEHWVNQVKKQNVAGVEIF